MRKGGIWLIVISLLLGSACTRKSAQPKPATTSSGLTFYVLSDWGFNGYFQQKKVAEAMIQYAEKYEKPTFVVSAGDNFQYNGVASVNDPLWQSNFENIYSHPVFLADWYPLLGNHEYHGNTQAIIDYAMVSRRWRMPARYYTMVKKVNDSTDVRLIFLDTTPFGTHYRQHPEKYPDAVLQDTSAQLAWLDSVLTASSERWKIVIGHHPLFSVDDKHGDTPELIAQIGPRLQKYHVDYYICGHIHTFQHLSVPGYTTRFIVNSSGGRARQAVSNQTTRFTSSSSGFTVCMADYSQFKVAFVDSVGAPIYQYSLTKK